MKGSTPSGLSKLSCYHIYNFLKNQPKSFSFKNLTVSKDAAAYLDL